MADECLCKVIAAIHGQHQHTGRSVHVVGRAFLSHRPKSCAALANRLPLGGQVAEQCLSKAKDLSGLLLLHTAKGSAQGMEDLVETCQAQGRSNVAFLGNFLLGHLDACVDLLISAGRTPEAAFFARTYRPHRISEVGLPPGPRAERDPSELSFIRALMRACGASCHQQPQFAS